MTMLARLVRASELVDAVAPDASDGVTSVGVDDVQSLSELASDLESGLDAIFDAHWTIAPLSYPYLGYASALAGCVQNRSRLRFESGRRAECF